MNPEHKRYILENAGKKSIKDIASSLQLKERVVRRFLEKERPSGKQKDIKTVTASKLTETKTNHLNILAIALIIIMGIAVYSNTLHNQFQYDDRWNITNNPEIKDLSNIQAIFNFMPTRFITDLTLAINYHFGRNDVLGYHIINLLIHLLGAIMVWWLTMLTLQTPSLRDKKISAHSGIIAFFTALIFVSHPIQTQGVTYIIQRAASLATLFYISSLAFYARSRLSRYREDSPLTRSIYYALSFIALILAMFSKEMTITLPFMILLYEACFFREGDRIDWERVIPFFITLIIIPITMAITKSVNFEEMRLSSQEGPGISPLNYLMTQFRVIVTYIRLLFIPLNQNLDYDYPMSKTLFDIPTLSSLILLAAILIIAIKLFRRYRLISFGIFFFFLALLPESSIIPIYDVIYEHRLYLPMAGFSIFLVSSIYYIFENKGIKPAIIILSLAGISYSALAYNRNSIWKDELTLWNDTVRKSPNKARVLYSCGNAYLNKGDIDRAISYYNKTIEIDPKYAPAYSNRGNAYISKGNTSQAMSDYNKAVEINPKYNKANYNLGAIYLKNGDLDRAISECDKAIEINPKHAEAYSNRGAAYVRKGSLGQAISDCDKAIELDPEHADAYNNRGYAYINKGDLDRGISDCAKAIELNPGYADAYNNRGVAYLKKGVFDRGISDCDKAIELDPKNADYYKNRGIAYLNKGNIDQSVSDFSKAIELDPKYADAYDNRAIAYFKKEQYAKSLEDVHKAQALGYKVNPELIEALKKVSGIEG